MYQIVDILTDKRDGKTLSDETIQWLIDAYTRELLSRLGPAGERRLAWRTLIMCGLKPEDFVNIADGERL